jgi:nucleoside-diphosphate-sugar epimerase
MKRVLITGVTGLVGDGICRYFLRNNWEVFGTSRRVLESNNSKFYPLKFDLESTVDLNVLSKHSPYRAVIHNAAKLPKHSEPGKDSDSYYGCNVKGTKHLLEWVEKSAIDTFIYISSMGVINSNNAVKTEKSALSPKPNHYHVSKAMGELLCEMYGAQGSFRTVILRISAPYGYTGTHASVIPKFVERARSNKDIELWGNGSRSQVFTFVEDIGHACRLAIEKSAVSGVYNIAGKESISMKGLAEKVLDTFPNSRSRIIFSEVKDPEEGKVQRISIAKAIRELGFEPKFNLLTGLNKVAEDPDEPLWQLKVS